jgi:glycolate oxidase iron-sulfur subunit
MPDMSDKILFRKVDNVGRTGAEYLVTSNPGCLLQLKAALVNRTPEIKVIHISELLMMSVEEGRYSD